MKEISFMFFSSLSVPFHDIILFKGGTDNGKVYLQYENE